jgi:hypothetical protein
MDDKIILKILEAIPADGGILFQDMHALGFQQNMLFEFEKTGLIRIDARVGNSTIQNYYSRTLQGNNWIRERQNEQRTEEHQSRIEALEGQKSRTSSLHLILAALAVFFAFVAAFQNLQSLADWLLSMLR